VRDEEMGGGGELKREQEQQASDLTPTPQWGEVWQEIFENPPGEISVKRPPFEREF
jgi:hypothetical protein